MMGMWLRWRDSRTCRLHGIENLSNTWNCWEGVHDREEEVHGEDAGGDGREEGEADHDGGEGEECDDVVLCLLRHHLT